MTRLMEEAPIFIWTGLNTMVTGEKISNTGMELRPGQMVQSMRATMNMVRSMALVLSSGQIIHNILVNFTITIFMEKGFILGVMAVDMRVNGKIIKCMGKEHSLGLMVENM